MATIIDALVVTLGLDNSEMRKGAEEADHIYAKMVKDAKAKAKAVLDAAKGGSKEEIATAKEAAKEITAAGIKAARAHSQAIRKEAAETVKKLEEEKEKSKEFFKEIATSAMELLGVMALATGMVEFAHSTQEAEVNASRLSETLGMNVEDLEALEGAVKRVGGSSEGMDQSLKGLNMQLQMIAIHGPRSKMALQVFAGLGISEVALKGKSAAEVMKMLSEHMKDMNQAKAMGLGQRLGMDEGTIRLLQQGGKGMEDLIRHVKSLGVPTKEETDRAREMEDKMLDLKDSLASVGRKILAVLMPAIQVLGDALAKVAAWASDHGEVVKGILIAVGTAFVFVGASALAAGIQAAWAWVLALGPLNLIIGAVAVIAGGLTLLIAHIKEVGHFFNWLAYQIAFHLLKAWFIAEKAAKKMWKSFKEAAMEPLEWVWGKLKAIFDVLIQNGKMFKALMHGDIKGAVTAAKAAVNDAASVYGMKPVYAGAPSAGMALRPSTISNTRSSAVSNSRTTHASIGTINIQTQATDANGIAKALPGAFHSTGLLDHADTGM